MKRISHIYHIILIVLIVLLLISTALCEQSVWDCPECGRTGNTGNYCGGCAHPAPWLETTTAPPTSTPSPTPTPRPTQTPTPAPTSRLQGFKTTGNIVTFGHYEQDDDTSNGTEEIEWIVLDVQEDKVLLISKYVLDVIPYNKTNANVTWASCSLRKWLNNNFLKSAFSKEEQAAIILSDIDNSNDQHGGYYAKKNYGGKNTKDKIFILSYAEANGFFFDKNAQFEAQSHPTVYASKKLYEYWRRIWVNSGIEIDAWADEEIKKDTEWADWWLRSPLEDFRNYVKTVYYNGNYKKYMIGDYMVNEGNGCVRPVFWLSLDSNVF